MLLYTYEDKKCSCLELKINIVRLFEWNASLNMLNTRLTFPYTECIPTMLFAQSDGYWFKIWLWSFMWTLKSWNTLNTKKIKSHFFTIIILQYIIDFEWKKYSWRKHILASYLKGLNTYLTCRQAYEIWLLFDHD